MRQPRWVSGALALVVALGVATGVATGAGAANASGPTPAPSSTLSPAIILYDGTAVVTDTTYGSSISLPANWTVDCTAAPCTITGAVVQPQLGREVPLTGGVVQPFPNGKGTYSYPTTGDICAGTFQGAYTIPVVASGNQITAVFDAAGFGTVVNCPDGSSRQEDPTHVEITSTVSSGNPCYIFGTCPKVSPTETITPLPIDGVQTTDISGTSITSASTLSTLPTLATALSIGNAAWAAVATIVLVILIAIPSHLINVAVEHGTDRFTQWWRTRRATPDARAEPVADGAPVRFAGWPFAAGGLLIASFISSFVSPTFGFNGSSVRVFASILVSFLIEAVAGWFIVIWLVRRATPHVTAAFRFVPATLLLVVAAVLFSRLTGFQPGIVFGLVAGVIFGSVLAIDERAKVALVPLGYGFSVAILGWIGYSLIALANGNPGGFVLFIQETLSAVTIAGIAALPIALVPLRGLAGYAVFRWNRWVWAAAYAIGMFGFFFVLMPKPFSWQTVGLSIWTWGALFVLYAVVGVVLWLVVVRPWKRAEAVDDETAPTG